MAGNFKRKTTTYGINFKNIKNEWLDNYGTKGDETTVFFNLFLTVMKRNGKRMTPKNFRLYGEVVEHLTSLNVTIESITPINKYNEKYFTKNIKEHGLNKANLILVVKDESIKPDMTYEEINKKIKEFLFTKIKKEEK